MNCLLMHKNIPVIDITISDVTGGIENKGKTRNSEHLPVGTAIPYGNSKGKVDLHALHNWWESRAIPASRDGLRDVVEQLGGNTLLLLSKCYGLSLSDQYWVCPTGSSLKWDDVNFFDNDFSSDVGEILFGQEPINPDNIDFRSPDNASDGQLRKKWIIVDGKRFLMKDGNGVFVQQPYNEVVADAVARRLGITHIPYTLSVVRGKPYSLCENFVTPATELVTAFRLTQTVRKSNNESYYMHFLRCADEYGIPNVREMAEQMIVLDYIIANEDRHWTNFGFIRNAETLEWVGMAPIFDNGTSLWYNTTNIGMSVGCKSFTKNHSENLKLVKDLAWFDPDALYGLDTEILDIYKQSATVDSKRASAIAREVLNRGMTVGRARSVQVSSAYGHDLDIVVAFIHNLNGDRIGLSVLNRSTGVVERITPFPDAGRYWNLTISRGIPDSRLCAISDFPVVDDKGTKNAGGWVVGEYEDGRLRLVSTSGAIKEVTQQTALPFHERFKFSNAAVVNGVLVGKNGRKFDKLT